MGFYCSFWKVKYYKISVQYVEDDTFALSFPLNLFIFGAFHTDLKKAAEFSATC